MMKKMMLMIALMLMPLQSYAASAWVEVNLTTIRTGVDSGVFYLFYDPIAVEDDPNQCGALSYAVVPTTNEWKIVHATALAALLADKPVRIKMNGCDGTKPTINWLEVFK